MSRKRHQRRQEFAGKIVRLRSREHARSRGASRPSGTGPIKWKSQFGSNSARRMYLSTPVHAYRRESIKQTLGRCSELAGG